MSGHVGDLSPYQEKILKEFKEAVADVRKPEHDDYYYLRWLRARNFEKDKAELMLRKNLIWRKKIGADTILQDYSPPEIINKYYPRGFLGLDKEGSPVTYMPFRNLDLRGFVHCISKFEILKFLTYMFEKDIALMKKESQRAGREIETHSYIVDLDGYTFRQATNRHGVDMLNEILRMYEANYPERLKLTTFINAPAFFSMALALSKPFLSEATVKKFRTFGRDGFKEFLLEQIDSHLLPVSLGGTRTDSDGDPTCKAIIEYGDFIPKSLYFIHNENKFRDENGVKCMTLDKRSFYTVEIQVDTPGSKLQWEVETNNNDIAIGLYYQRSSASSPKTQLEDVLPVERVSCHLVPDSFTYICEKTGTYILKFDNSYSWFSQKKVYYRISLQSIDTVQLFE